MGMQRNYTKTQQSGHIPRYGPEIKDRSRSQNWCTEEAQMQDRTGASQILQLMTASAARILLPFYPA